MPKIGLRLRLSFIAFLEQAEQAIMGRFGGRDRRGGRRWSRRFGGGRRRGRTSRLRQGGGGRGKKSFSFIEKTP